MSMTDSHLKPRGRICLFTWARSEAGWKTNWRRIWTCCYAKGIWTCCYTKGLAATTRSGWHSRCPFWSIWLSSQAMSMTDSHLKPRGRICLFTWARSEAGWKTNWRRIWTCCYAKGLRTSRNNMRGPARYDAWAGRRGTKRAGINWWGWQVNLKRWAPSQSPIPRFRCAGLRTAH